MAENKSNPKLFVDFPPVTTPEWEEVIHKDLKGADYDKKLVWKTLEGFNVQPYYRSEHLKDIKSTHALPGEFPYARGVNPLSNSWLVRQDFEATNAPQANKKAIDGLERGLNSVGFVIPSSCKASSVDVASLLKSIDPTKNEINFVAGCGSATVLPLLVDVLKKSGVDMAKAKGSFDYSPLTALTLNGKFCVDQKSSVNRAVELFNSAKDLPNFKLMSINGDVFRNAGSSVTQELAFALSMGVEYVDWLTEKGVSIQEAFRRIFMTLAVGSSYFMEIAKFRAARLLWAKIAEAYGCANCEPLSIHATNSLWNKTVYDPYVNMLRTTTETMAATLGGVHSFTVLPFDAPYQEQTEFSERVARNQQIVIKEEAYFDKVVDPAAGSYYIENLTQSLITHAWELFQKVQGMGGYLSAFTQGFIQSEINSLASKREANIATRRQTVLGTNQYPNFIEIADTAVVSKGTVIRAVAEKSANAIAEPLPQFRGSQEFEQLRYTTDASGKRPKVFMLTLGSLAFRRARAQFSSNFFACAGFEVIDNIGFKTVDEGVKAALDAKSDIVVICSSDDEYLTLAPEAFEKLAGKAVFVVAGEPASKSELEAKGIKNFISVKSNALETLREYQKMLKIV